MVGNLNKVTPKPWPKWKEMPGQLTIRGALMENYMGDYFAQWFQEESFLQECPGDSAVVYSNICQRTYETAKNFIKTAFKTCNLTINRTDKYFTPNVRSKSDAFMKTSVEEMKKKANQLDLANAYEKINTILDINNSQICKEDSICDLRQTENKFVFKFDMRPSITGGGLFIAGNVVDAFLMAYYNGIPERYIGWGGIKSEDWETLTEVLRGFQYVRWNSSYYSPHLVKPLTDEIYRITSTNETKIAMFFGHDANLCATICALGFKQFALPNSFLKTPLGGKLVFQKWYDEVNDRFLLKVEYKYLTTEQLRQGTTVYSDSPPNSVVMELNGCAVDDEGFCPWEDFVKILEKLQ